MKQISEDNKKLHYKITNVKGTRLMDNSSLIKDFNKHLKTKALHTQLPIIKLNVSVNRSRALQSPLDPLE